MRILFYLSYTGVMLISKYNSDIYINIKCMLTKYAFNYVNKFEI